MPHRRCDPTLRSRRPRPLATLIERLERLQAIGGLDSRPLLVAASQFHAICEGLAAAELRGALAHTTDPADIWADGLAALVKEWQPTGPPETTRQWLTTPSAPDSAALRATARLWC